MCFATTIQPPRRRPPQNRTPHQVEEAVADRLARQAAGAAPEHRRRERRVGHEHDVLAAQGEAHDRAVAVGPLERGGVVVGAHEVGDVAWLFV